MQLDVTVIAERLARLVDEAIAIWLSGGWAMIPIAAVAVLMFGMAIHVHLGLARTGHRSVGERKWRRWIDDPSLRRGRIGELLDVATGCRTLEELSRFFEERLSTQVAPFERDLRVLKLAVTAAPLLGLLGTVTGMLTTFAALASGAGGDETMKMVASGISEALVTTETGLVVALPGLFLHSRISRSVEIYKAFLAHLESVLAQRLFRLQHDQEAA